MVRIPKGWGLLASLAFGLLQSQCAIQNYPGQPGVRTNGFAKIDMETVDESGLWVYEVSYDNSVNGQGVEQVVTKLYPKALTYTSNVRTNADGSTYRHKFPYKGAKIQMISLPKDGTVILPPDSEIFLMVDYELSMSEIDDRNLSEDDLFTSGRSQLEHLAKQTQMRWNVLKAGEFVNGKLYYSIHRLRLGTELLDLAKNPLQISTNLAQNGIQLNINAAQKQQIRAFINEKFPQGFKGEIELGLGGGASFKTVIGLNTLETIKASGKKVLIQDISANNSVAE